MPDDAMPHPDAMPDADVAELCADLVRFDTTNRGGGDSAGERDAAEYVADRLTTIGLRPSVLESAPRRANVIARVPGTDPDAEAVLVHAHLDVVPADPAEWSVPPFSGEIRDGYVWGRGSTDMKDMAAMVLGVLSSWHRRGFQPRRDIVVAFVADEEDHGEYGAGWLVEHHPALFDGCAVAISESGGATHHLRRADDDASVRLYPIGAAERGSLHMRVTAHGRAGHGSRPNDENAVVRLVEALGRVAAYRWPVRVTPTVRAYVEGTAAALGVPVDWDDIDATLDRFGPAAGLARTTLRNSATPTVLEAGYKVNVVPGTAEALLDARSLPGFESEALETLDELLGPHVTREFVDRATGVQAPIDTGWLEAMGDALRSEDPEAVVVPNCMGGGTDAKAFTRLGIACYGFSPLLLPESGYDLRSMAHGVDERVPVEGIRFGARVLDRFLSS